MGKLQPTHAVTLNPNEGDISIDLLKRRFALFCREVDRLRYGRNRVENIPSDERFQAIAFPEHLSSNAHLHIFADLGFRWMGRRLEEDFFNSLSERYNRLSRGRAQLHLRLAYDAEGWSDYITKELVRIKSDPLRKGTDFFWSADFHPLEKVVESGKFNKILDLLNPKKLRQEL
jgi:hypothetical protein